MENRKTKKYTAENIKTLSGLEHIQARKGMYLNNIDGMFLEMFHNALDEVSNGYGSFVEIKLHKNGAWSCQDTGRGIPVGKDKKSGENVQDRVFLNTNTGGKFDSDAFDFSIGLHGLGNKIITALSKYVKVKIKRDGVVWEAEYKDGGKHNKLSHKTGTCKQDDTGTYVEFLVDEKYFEENEKIQPQMVKDHLQEISYLFSNLTISYIDEINNERIKYQSKEGIKSYVTDTLGSSKLVGDIITIPMTSLPNGEKAELAFAWTNKEDVRLISFVNLLNMVDGGTHVDGFNTGVYETIQQFANQNHDEKIKNPKFELEDALEGIVCCISTFVPEKIIKFQGQVKSKLLSPQLKTDIRTLVIQHLTQWLNKNKELGKKIIKNIYASRDARIASEKARTVTKTLREAKKLKISDKYSRPTKFDSSKNELFVVEGLSAKGSVDKAKNEYQGIFAIRGKLPNCQQWALKDVLSNEEVQSIVAILGCGLGNKFDMKKLNFSKVVVLADQDVDGYHISCLFLTLMNKLFPELIKQGKVFVGMSPLYQATCKDASKEYFWDDTQKDKWMEKNKSKVLHLSRFKGLGECQHTVLKETSMDPNTRHIIKVTQTNINRCQDQLRLWMDKDALPRKEWINKNVDFSKAED